MGIEFLGDKGIFHLFNQNFSYIIYLTKELDIVHLYWGKKIDNPDVRYMYRPCLRAFSPNSHPENIDLSYDTMPLEFPFFGSGDFRHPVFEVEYEDGSRVSELKYRSHRIESGKPPLEGLPSTYSDSENEVQNLVIELIEKHSGLTLELQYAVFEGHDVITRSARFQNGSENPMLIHRALSFALNFPHDDFEMIQLSGSWARERHLYKRKLVPGIQSIDSTRGSSSHMQNPFLALQDPGSGEFWGNVYGFSLLYSGNFLAEVEVDQFHTSRVSMGINPFGFRWQLESGSTFQTPEAVLVYSSEGLNQMSVSLHSFFREHLCRGKYKLKERPVLINNWEATYFDFNEKKLLAIATSAKDLGIELFVLDDGWFGKRDADNCSLGDWVVDKRKLPSGLSGLAEKIREMGLLFGLWVEPEMISENSDLFRSHPDWCLHIPGRRRTESRNQLVLDLSRKEVCDWMIETLTTVFSSALISYVKWDMNRNMTQVWSASYPPEQQGEIYHRYILGLYRVLETLTRTFPDILFESCSGGGGRFDPGMLYYMPQTWTSDNTDAIERLKIQYGTSLVYPPITMGAHVSAVPNHQVQRTSPLMTRLSVAMSGNFGFELDLSSLDTREKEVIRLHTALYKTIRPVIQFGDFYRLISPFEQERASWMFVSSDRRKVVVFYCRILSSAHMPQETIKLKGLDDNKEYLLLNYDPFFEALGYDKVYRGDSLMHAGFRIPPMIGDFQSSLLRFEAD